MRVMHVVHSLQHGGQERVIVDLVRHAQPAITPCVLVGERGGPLEAVVAEAGGLVRHLPTAGRRARWAALRDVVAELRPDVIHAHNAWAIHVTAEALGRRHDRPALLATRHGQWLPKGLIARWRYRHACGRFDTIVSVSETAARAAIADGFVQSRQSRVIRNGIDLARFSERRAAAEPGPQPDASPDVVFVGRLEPIKGLMVLLEAAHRIRLVQPEVRFTILGDGSQREALVARVAELGLGDTVHLAGPVLDVVPRLQGATVGVLPSFSEGISISLLEMMACGLPVVATAVGGTPEFLQDEDNGLLVPAGDAERLAAAILRLVGDRGFAARLGARATETVHSGYGVRTMADAYAAAYEMLVRREEPA